MTLNFEPHEKLNLKEHPDFTEAWLRERIQEDPTILGFGELLVRDTERRQGRAGGWICCVLALVALSPCPTQDRAPGPATRPASKPRYSVEVLPDGKLRFTGTPDASKELLSLRVMCAPAAAGKHGQGHASSSGEQAVRWRLGLEEFTDLSSLAWALDKAAQTRRIADPDHVGKTIPMPLVIEFDPAVDDRNRLEAELMAENAGFLDIREGVHPSELFSAGSRPTSSGYSLEEIERLVAQQRALQGSASRPSSRDR